MYHRHLRSSVAGKLPTPAQLDEGQIAVNFNAADPFLTIKDSAGAVRRITGVSRGTSAPATPSAGWLWLDTTRPSSPTLKIYDGTNWLVAGSSGAPASTTQPTAPVKGDLWVDTSGAAPVLKVYSGTGWLTVDTIVPTATTSSAGISQLATAADVTTGASDRVVTADLLKATNTAITAAAYTLPPATTTTLGGIKVGTNLTVAADGTLNASVTGAITYAGALDVTVAAPAAPKVDGLYVVSKAGTAHASFTGAAGVTVAAGDWILWDGAKWDHINAMAAATTPDATSTVKGVIRIATNTEATTGTATNLAVTPAQLKVVNDAIATATGGGITGITGTAPITTSGTGATRAIAISDATNAASGAMSAADKTKLDGIAAGAEVNVQVDWNEADNTSDAFIKNKPTIPAAYTLPIADATTLGGIKKGTGYTISSDGTLSITFPAALTFKGPIDPTTAAPATKATGDVYIASNAGVAAASWTGLAGTAVSLHELLVWDGTEWAGAGVGSTTGVTSVTAGANTGITIGGTATAPVVSGSDATATSKGVVQLATAAEAQAGTDTAKAVTAAGVKAAIAALTGSASTSAPTSPTKGTLWTDTSGAIPVVKVYDGTTWHSLADLNGPTFIGIPSAPTATAGTNTTQLATTAFVQAAQVWSRTGTTLGPKTPGDLVAVGALPAATTATNGVVRLADAAAITAGTTGRVVDAAQLRAHVPAAATDAVSGIVELATAAETTTGTDATRAVTPAGLKVELGKKANLASPALTGTPTAPTAAAATNTTQIATTAFVTAAVTAAAVPAASETVSGKVELATTAEVLTGTDTVRAVTPKGLKDHYLLKDISLLPALP